MHGHYLQIILTTCILSESANLDLSPGNQTDAVFEQVKLRYAGRLTLSRAVTCTVEGATAINCTHYEVCLNVGGGVLLGAEGECVPPQNFNPYTNQCDATFQCPECTGAGFFCPTSTSFTYCSDAPVVVVRNIQCPAQHYCNRVCKHPCLINIVNC